MSRGKIKFSRTKTQREISKSEDAKLKLASLERTSKRLAFNFSFLTNDSHYSFENSHFDETVSKKLFIRLHDLSVVVKSKAFLMDKKHGIEKYSPTKKDDLYNKADHREFGKERRKMSGDDYFIFRLFPNNTPIPCRVIGRIIDETFYVMFIDYEHELYAKRK
ncbi:hypothetical protein LJ555_11630 [Lacticaseibacillus paracasei]|uniref:hypothetical protein n=1 Tax=Lacticaseibacillus paracasei TaxID=1597 RepID=UPI000516357B|nr:hypothetical protein [Lacticaseibacillus paracasei]MCT3362087.1 hypothetical protein [Lacticaseibacillus paracasei]MDN4554924.1 hypothetical protein [Lacticaseibacillus paracasei]UNG77805.1 hypothetical protein LJ555_11630 [Lacticaseibacillus paracasei]